MVAYADSSFLVSVYVDDVHTDAAQAYLSRHGRPLRLPAFARSEAQHALRMLAFRKIVPEEEVVRALLTFEQDQAEGLYEPARTEADLLFQKASQLSQRHAAVLGVRYLDLLHVASALAAKASVFLTFDGRQRELAKKAGLAVPL